MLPVTQNEHPPCSTRGEGGGGGGYVTVPVHDFVRERTVKKLKLLASIQDTARRNMNSLCCGLYQPNPPLPEQSPPPAPEHNTRKPAVGAKQLPPGQLHNPKLSPGQIKPTPHSPSRQPCTGLQTKCKPSHAPSTPFSPAPEPKLSEATRSISTRSVMRAL